ncbi:sphingosine-1-phosphate lyase isoform X2 [Culicoides brevitarsis]
MSKTIIRDSTLALRGAVNGAFANREPWQVAAITTTTVLSLVWLWSLINQDESIYTRLKRRVFKLTRKIPMVQAKINEELVKLKKDFENDMLKSCGNLEYITKMPFESMNEEQILKKLDEHLQLGNYKYKDGKVSGAVYTCNPKLVQMVKEVYGKASYTNPLHSDLFPGICKMEAEVIRMLSGLFHGGSDACGSMTTGGTESIVMACKAYRDYAREVRGIKRPNMVLPVTAHTAFDKAGQYFNIYRRTVAIDPQTTKVDIKAMEKAINKNTIMLVGSAPNFPYGTIDDIQAIAKLGLKYNIPVHVDACLGGFIIIFMKRAGYPLKPFDFAVKGVTSISADTHKYGFTPKGSSVILYSEPKYRHYQFTVSTDWPGGIYGSPTVNGSRAGGVIAATWATMLFHGEDGYTESTKRIVDITKYIENGLRKIKNIYIFGVPDTSVIAFGSKDFDIYRLSDALNKKGWNLNGLQFPPGLHICITDVHTQEGIADQFVNDVKEQVAEIMKNPGQVVEGKMAIYGVSQALPDRSLVGDFIKLFLDSLVYTPQQNHTSGK